GIDLDAGIILSSAGTNPNFVKAGSGTMRLTNNANTANFNVSAGRLQVDNTALAPLGSGTVTLAGGTLTYGNNVANGSTSKAIGLGTGRGSIEMSNNDIRLTTSIAISLVNNT